MVIGVCVSIAVLLKAAEITFRANPSLMLFVDQTDRAISLLFQYLNLKCFNSLCVKKEHRSIPILFQLKLK